MSSDEHDDLFPEEEGDTCFPFWDDLHQAVLQDEYEEVISLVSSGADINSKRYVQFMCGQFVTGVGALHLAVSKRKYEMVLLLVELGADVNHLTGYDEFDYSQITLTHIRLTPMHIAVMQEDREMVQLLIEFGPDLEIQDNDQRTPLEWSMANAEIAAVLIANGARFDVWDANFWPDQGPEPLIFRAIRHHNLELVAILSQLQDPSLLYEDYTPVMLAMNEFPEAVDVLLTNRCHQISHRCGSYQQTALHFALMQEQEEWIKQLIQQRADVNAQDTDLNTPLHYAVFEKLSVQVLLKLISGGADPNMKNRFDHTPLNYAVEEGCTEMIEVLLRFDTKLSNNFEELRSAFEMGQANSALTLLQYIDESGKSLKDFAEEPEPLIWSMLKFSLKNTCIDEDLMCLFTELIRLRCPLDSVDAYCGTLLHYLIYGCHFNEPSSLHKRVELFKSIFVTLLEESSFDVDQDFEPADDVDSPMFSNPLTFALSMEDTGFFFEELVRAGADLDKIDWNEVFFSKDKVAGLKAMFYRGFKFTDAHLNILNPLNNEDLLIKAMQQPKMLESARFHYDKFCCWLAKHSKQVWSLKELARLTIHRQCGRRIVEEELFTNIPIELTGYLFFK